MYLKKLLEHPPVHLLAVQEVCSLHMLEACFLYPPVHLLAVQEVCSLHMLEACFLYPPVHLLAVQEVCSLHMLEACFLLKQRKSYCTISQQLSITAQHQSSSKRIRLTFQPRKNHFRNKINCQLHSLSISVGKLPTKREKSCIQNWCALSTFFVSYLI